MNTGIVPLDLDLVTKVSLLKTYILNAHNKQVAVV